MLLLLLPLPSYSRLLASIRSPQSSSLAETRHTSFIRRPESCGSLALPPPPPLRCFFFSSSLSTFLPHLTGRKPSRRGSWRKEERADRVNNTHPRRKRGCESTFSSKLPGITSIYLSTSLSLSLPLRFVTPGAARRLYCFFSTISFPFISHVSHRRPELPVTGVKTCPCLFQVFSPPASLLSHSSPGTLRAGEVCRSLSTRREYLHTFSPCLL